MLGKQDERSVFGSKDDHRKITKEYTLEDAKRDERARLERRKITMPGRHRMPDADMPLARLSVMHRKSNFGY
jgi:hypothetical protein